jgi:hypothetical protein
MLCIGGFVLIFYCLLFVILSAITAVMETSTPQNPLSKNPSTLGTPTRNLLVDHERQSSGDFVSQCLAIFRQQEQVVTHYFETTPPSQLLFYIASKKSQFVETKTLQVARYLNMRDNAGLLPLQHLFNHLHIVDDLVMSINNHLPPQRPIGWQLLSQNKNFMNLPTVGVAGDAPDYRGIEQSLAATVIQFLGVACYHHDRGYFVGHIVGYLFSCYYFAHLGIGYAVTPLKSLPQASYPYQSVSVTQLVRLLQELDETLKTQVYQLAIYCAQISEYALEKRIEKLLITEVNSFNKQALRDELSVLVQYDLSEKEALFQPIKPLK